MLVQFVSLLVTRLALICLNILLGLAFVCLQVPANIEKNLLVWMGHFISGGVFGGRNVGLNLDLCFGGGGSVFLKLSFGGGGGVFYFEIFRILY